MIQDNAARILVRPESPAPPRELTGVAVVALAAFVLLMAVSTRFGYHRDELYFLEASKHMAWGYVDQPPLAVGWAWLARELFGGSLAGLRLLPALCDAAAIVLTGLIARELGGRRVAQVVAAISVASAPIFLAGSHTANTTPFDLLAWAAILFFLVRLIRTGDGRLWLAIGAVTGLALLNNETILLLVAGVAVGVLVNRQGRLLASPWLWAGAVLALVIWSPNLIWETRHHWPSLAMSRSLRREHSGLGSTITFVLNQVLLPGWWVILLWLAGLWALWRDTAFRPYRWAAVAYAVMFVANAIVIGDRPYYLSGIYTLALAAGACVLEGALAGRHALFRSTARRKPWIWRSPRAVVVWIVVVGAIGLIPTLPVLPASAVGTLKLNKANYDLGEQIGWPSFVGAVARAYDSLPAADRRTAVIVTSNYGEASAIAWFGPRLGLPRAYSGHNNYWFWGTPHPSGGPALLVGFDRDQLPANAFAAITLAGTVHNQAGVDNDEEGAPVWLCRGQTTPWTALWPTFRHYG
ncbi:MAG TPA: glycosyltransferase family 39 protein [Actinomycetota bacterium]|nr:glycosyltransferase family 39 protein [Actinomycetota bacterium]